MKVRLSLVTSIVIKPTANTKPNTAPTPLVALQLYFKAFQPPDSEELTSKPKVYGL